METVKSKEQYLEEELHEKEEVIKKLVNSLNSMSNQNDYLLRQNKLIEKQVLSVRNEEVFKDDEY